MGKAWDTGGGCRRSVTRIRIGAVVQPQSDPEPQPQRRQRTLAKISSQSPSVAA